LPRSLIHVGDVIYNYEHDRANAGVHDEVTPGEARILFLETYTVLGEVLTLNDGPEVTTPSGGMTTGDEGEVTLE
jgi:hypothetical protein